MKNIIFNLFDTYDTYEEIIDALRSLETNNEITEEEYNNILTNYNDYLNEYNNLKEIKIYE